LCCILVCQWSKERQSWKPVRESNSEASGCSNFALMISALCFALREPTLGPTAKLTCGCLLLRVQADVKKVQRIHIWELVEIAAVHSRRLWSSPSQYARSRATSRRDVAVWSLTAGLPKHRPLGLLGRIPQLTDTVLQAATLAVHPVFWAESGHGRNQAVYRKDRE
jgi:hypothetical protein